MEQNRTLSSIVCDPSLQVRECLDESWVAELSDLYRGNHVMPAVTVVFDGARDLLVDGWHRIEAQRRAWGPDAVIAVVVVDASASPDPMAVAKMRAAMANREAGLRRTDSDKRRAVLLLRSTPEGRRMKHDEIAKCVGVSRSRVTQILSEAEASAQVSANNTGVVVNYGGASRQAVAALWAQVDAALKEDTGKSNEQHAADLKCDAGVVRRRRAALGLPKSDPKRWKPSARDEIVAELERDPDQPNRVVAEKTGAAPETVSKIRDELGLAARKRGPSKPSAPPPSGPSVTKAGVQKLVGVLDKLTAPPSAPVNKNRTDDPREQGAEVIPLRPPPSKKPDIVTETLQRLETAHPTDRQAVITAIWKRWPHMVKNAIEEEREEAVVLQ